MTGSFVFRALAAAQLAFEASLYVVSAVKRWAYGDAKTHRIIDADGSLMGEVPIPQGVHRSDVAEAARHLGKSIRTGHVDQRLFLGAAMQDEVDLREPLILYDDEVLFRVVLAHGHSALRSGALRGGLLPSFVRSQLGHVLECEKCHKAVLREVRASVECVGAIDSLLGSLGMGPNRHRPENDTGPRSVN